MNQLLVRTLWWFRHGGTQTVHVVASVAIVTKQQLVLQHNRTTDVNIANMNNFEAIVAVHNNTYLLEQGSMKCVGLLGNCEFG